MNHPNRGDWVPYLFGEAKPEVRQQIRAHLDVCPECNAEFERWQRSLNRLESWRLPSTRQPTELFAPMFRWAAAAGLVLGLGFAVGRWATSHRDAQPPPLASEQVLRQEVARLVREEIDRAAPALLAAASEQAERIAAAYAASVEVKRVQDNRVVQAVLVTLKKELDTVAVNTEQELVQVADYRLPANHTEPPRN